MTVKGEGEGKVSFLGPGLGLGLDSSCTIMKTHLVFHVCPRRGSHA